MSAGLGIYSPGAVLLRQACQLVFPRRCPFCGQVLGSVPACPDCAPELRRHIRAPQPGQRRPPPGFAGSAIAWAAVPYWYDGMIRSALLRAKYADQPWAAVQLGCLMAHRLFGVQVPLRGGVEVPLPLAQPVIDCDLIVPTPSSGRGRAYNVPALMCLPLAHALGIPLEGRALLRTRKGTAQAGLSREERQHNAAGLFKGVADYAAGRRILLVDDVVTTGATAAACARALAAAGAESVAVIGFATPWANRGLPAVPGLPFDAWDETDGDAEELEDFCLQEDEG